MQSRAPDMTHDALDSELRSIIDRFGYERVDLSLRQIGRAERGSRGAAAGRSRSDDASTKAKRRRPKLKAAEYVSRMDLPADRRRVLTEAAESFQNKLFLPTVGDVRNFCGIYGIEQPASSSRASAIPRVFKFIATMDTEEIRRMLHGGMFSEPVRLGPIADAIRDAGRQRIRNRASHAEATSTREAAE